MVFPHLSDIPYHSMTELFIADGRRLRAVCGEVPEAVDPLL